MSKKVTDSDTLFKVRAQDISGEPFNLGLVFRQRIPNFALKFISGSHQFSWDSIRIIMDFKCKKKNLYNCEFQVIFLSGEDIVYSLRNIYLTKHEYKPFFNTGI